MKKVRSIGLAAAIVVMLNGCLLTSPYWNQQFRDHTKAIPLQAFTTNKSVPVKFECAKAYHGGLYPSAASANWVVVAKVNPQSQALWDPTRNSRWYAAVRATQNPVIGTEQNYFHTFDKAGLECLGKEDGKATSRFGWFSASCQSGAQYTIFRATS